MYEINYFYILLIKINVLNSYYNNIYDGSSCCDTAWL
ncbi:MAG: hypothetical protein JWQ14_3565 [Adhaeribacter sp.]|nr:hypothetical protein [Adhaeribacter sp.]